MSPSSAPDNTGVAPSPQDLPPLTHPATIEKVTAAAGVAPTAPVPTKNNTVVSTKASLGAFAAPDNPAAVTSSAVRLGSSGAARGSAARVPEIPANVEWVQPTTVTKAAVPGGERAVVTYVGDGDSAQLRRQDGSTVVCRIDSIDAPEVAHPQAGKPGQPFGEESKRILASMIANREVTLRITKPASAKNYNRALCQIEVEGHGVDAEMLRQGAAWLYREYANSPALAAAEAAAVKERRGLWNLPNPEYPATFRHRTGK